MGPRRVKGWEAVTAASLIAAGTTFGALAPAASAEVLPAPSFATVAPQLRPACLIGEWESSDLTSYYRQLMSQVGMNNIQVTGNVHMNFRDDGRFGQGIDNVVVAGDTSMGHWVQTMSGAISGNYAEPSSGVLMLSDFTTSASTSVTVDGQIFIDNADMSPLGAETNSSTMNYECSGDRMTMSAPGGATPPLVFHRCGASIGGAPLCQSASRASSAPLLAGTGEPTHDEPWEEYDDSVIPVPPTHDEPWEDYDESVIAVP